MQLRLLQVQGYCSTALSMACRQVASNCHFKQKRARARPALTPVHADCALLGRAGRLSLQAPNKSLQHAAGVQKHTHCRQSGFLTCLDSVVQSKLQKNRARCLWIGLCKDIHKHNHTTRLLGRVYTSSKTTSTAILPGTVRWVVELASES
jgi:hypothetical protein